MGIKPNPGEEHCQPITAFERKRTHGDPTVVTVLAKAESNGWKESNGEQLHLKMEKVREREQLPIIYETLIAPYPH